MNQNNHAITASLADGVLLLGFNRPETRNALTQDMYSQLAQYLEKASSDVSIRVVVLHGSSSAFTSGNDIRDFASRTSSEPTSLEERPSSRFMDALLLCSKPIVAAVNGPAVGVGATMLLHCDLVFAGSNALITFPFVRLGLCPEFGSSLLLANFVGQRNAMQLLLTGSPCNAERALALGLVNEVLDPANTLERAQEVAREMAAHSIQSLIATKRLARTHLIEPSRTRIAEERVTFERLLTTPEARAAFERFLAGKSKHASPRSQSL